LQTEKGEAMKLIEWLKQFFRNKPTKAQEKAQNGEFIIIDTQCHIHTTESIKRRNHHE